MKIITCAALALAVFASPAIAESLKVSSYLPPKHKFTEAIVAWGEELAAKSGGRLTVEMFPAGQLGPVNRQFDLITRGGADAAIVLHSATPGRFPMTELAGLPLTHPSSGDSSAAASRRLTELAPQYLAAEHPGAKILWMAVTPPLKINLKGDAPKTLDDLKGKRIRYAGQVFQKVLDAIGATPLPVKPSEVQEGLAKGIIDGAMFPYEATVAFDLGPELDASLEPGIASATFAFAMSQAKYDALPADLRAIIDETTGPERAASFGASWDEGEKAGRSYLTDTHDVKIVTLPPAEQDKLRALLGPIVEGGLAEVEASGAPARAFYAAYVK